MGCGACGAACNAARTEPGAEAGQAKTTNTSSDSDHTSENHLIDLMETGVHMTPSSKAAFPPSATT